MGLLTCGNFGFPTRGLSNTGKSQITEALEGFTFFAATRIEPQRYRGGGSNMPGWRTAETPSPRSPRYAGLILRVVYGL